MTDHKIDSNSNRYKFNRLLGLGGYAAGVLALVGTIFALVETVQHKNGDYQTVTIFAAATFILFGLGYSTSRRS